MTKHDVAVAAETRNVLFRDVKPVEQRLHVRLLVEIDVREGMSVAREELLHAERLRAVTRTNHDRIADPARDELHPPQDEGPHEELTDLGIRLDQREELL